MNTINDRINLLIEHSGMTKTAFAAKLNVSQQYASKLIRTGKPSDLLVEDICQKFNVNIEWLVHGNGEMFKPLEEKFATYVSEIDDSDDDFIKNFIEVYMELDEPSKQTLKEIGRKMAEKYKNRAT